MAFNRIGRDTGSGKVRNFILPDRGRILCRYELYNFNIDGSVLKPEHKDFLNVHIIPLMKKLPVHIKLTGRASKSGDRDYNRQLSLERVLRVKEYLTSNGLQEAQVPGTSITAEGEDQSISLYNEDEFDRSVILTIAEGIKYLPLPIPQKIPVIGTIPIIILPPVIISVPPTDKSSKWTLMEISGYNLSATIGPSFHGIGLGAGVGGIHYDFLLVNRRTAQMAQCALNAMGGTAGAGAGISVGVASAGGSFTYMSGKWDNFSSREAIEFSDFNGKAAIWSEASLAGGTSVSRARLVIPKLGVDTFVTTGQTVGFPAGNLAPGYIVCDSPVQLHLPR